MKKIDTDDLEMIIQNSPHTKINELIMTLEEIQLTDHLNDLLNLKEITISNIINLTLLDRTYAYQIFQGKRMPGRNKLLQIAIALKLDLNETNRLLTIGHHERLYAKQPQDAAIIYCISNNYNVDKTNEYLLAQNLSVID